jgi:hypothetical protein
MGSAEDLFIPLAVLLLLGWLIVILHKVVLRPVVE